MLTFQALQIQDFSGMIVALILVVDPMFFRQICSEKYTLAFGYLRIFKVIPQL
jgi:hypothetical protein